MEAQRGWRLYKTRVSGMEVSLSIPLQRLRYFLLAWEHQKSGAFCIRVPPSQAGNATCVKSTTVVQAGSQSKASSRAEDSRDEKGNRSAGKAGPLGKHRPPRLAEGKARLWNKAASSALFSTLSLPLSICLSGPFSLLSPPLSLLPLQIFIC